MARLYGNALVIVAEDANGSRVPEAQLYLYVNNTTTPQSMYSDSDLTTETTFPAIADGAGSFGPIYAVEGTYTIDVTDANGDSLPGYPANDWALQSRSEGELTDTIAAVQQYASDTAGDAATASESALTASSAALAAGASIYAGTTEFIASGDTHGIVPEDNGYRHYENVSDVATPHGWIKDPAYDTPAALVASTSTGWYAGQRVTAGPFLYEVVASGGHITTAGGVSLDQIKDESGALSLEACSGVNPTDVSIITVSDNYLSAPALVDRSNVIFVGDGNFAGTNQDTSAYRRQVIPAYAPSAQAFPDVIADDLGLVEDAKIVLVGDSLTSYGANSISGADVLAERLEAQFKTDNRGKPLTLLSRGIGSTTYDEFDGVPTTSFVVSDRYPWYTDVSRDWMDYIEDQSPDIVILSFGMNDSDSFDETAFASVVAKVLALPSEPKIIFCTNMVPNLSPPVGGESFATYASQEGRDSVAGYVRTYAAFYGYSCIDINRTFNLLRDGRDILDCYFVEQAEVTFASAEVYEATSSQSCRDYSIRAEIEAAAYTNSSALAVKTGPDSNNVVFIDDNSGFLRFKYYGGGSSSLFETETSDIPTPTTDVTWEFSTKSSPGGSTFSARIIPDASGADAGADPFSATIIRHGGLFQPKVFYFSGGGTGPVLSATLYQGFEQQYMPTILDVDLWGDDLSGEGNGRNHPTSKGAAAILGAHFSAQNYSLPWAIEDPFRIGGEIMARHTGTGSVGIGNKVTGDLIRHANTLGEIAGSQPSSLNSNTQWMCLGFVNGTTDQERTTSWRRLS